MPPADPVQITRVGRVTRLRPAPEALGDLRVRRPVLAGGAWELVDIPLFGVRAGAGGEYIAYVWGGTEGAARGIIGRPRPASPAAPAPPLPPGRAPLDPGVVWFARNGGLVLCGPGVDPCLLAAQCCAVLPGRHVVLARTLKQQNAFLATLLALGVRAEASNHRRICSGGARVTVTTLGAAGMVPLDRAAYVYVLDALHRADDDPIVRRPADTEFASPPPAAAPGLLERLARSPWDTRVVGFHPSGRPFSPFEVARCLQAYGPRELRVPRHGTVGRDVEVAWHQVALAPGFAPQSAAPEAAARRRVELDPVRLRRTVLLARLLAAGDGIELRRQFPTVAPHAPTGRTLRVVLLCGDLDQAGAAARRLPGWPLVSGLSDAGTDPAGPGVIATEAGAFGLGPGPVDAVVRADAGPGLPAVPDRWLETDQVPAPPLLVVDGRHGGDRGAAKLDRSRRRAYLAAGWPDAGELPDAFAARRFRHVVLGRGGRS